MHALLVIAMVIGGCFVLLVGLLSVMRDLQDRIESPSSQVWDEGTFGVTDHAEATDTTTWPA